MPAEEQMVAALRLLPSKPDDTQHSSVKKQYSEAMSASVAITLAAIFKERGMAGIRPVEPGELDMSGAERRLAGGIGAKKVDVTWATEESGLLFGCSIKTINFRDKITNNFQKNLTNRRGDMLFEAVTLHRRFPYAVLGGLFLLDAGAATDDTERRASTFLNAHSQFRLFTGRSDPAGREEQFEQFFLGLVNASPAAASLHIYRVGSPHVTVTLDDAVDQLCAAVVERNSDFYEWDGSTITKR